MNERHQVNNFPTVCIVYRQSDPRQIFIEVKDDSLPMKVYREALCPLGGNWIGEEARSDKGPRETLVREINEELTLERNQRDLDESATLGLSENAVLEQTPISGEEVREIDIEKLNLIKSAIIDNLEPFGDYILDISKRVLDEDADNAHLGFKALTSYFTAGLDEEVWSAIEELQKRFGNLSTESTTVVTSLGDILEKNLRFAYSHDQVFKKFFVDAGYAEATAMSVFDNPVITFVGQTRETYDEYLVDFVIKKTPYNS